MSFTVPIGFVDPSKTCLLFPCLHTMMYQYDMDNDVGCSDETKSIKEDDCAQEQKEQKEQNEQEEQEQASSSSSSSCVSVVCPLTIPTHSALVSACSSGAGFACPMCTKNVVSFQRLF